jgi:phosphatidylinositol alpha-mannosyltransferase
VRVALVSPYSWSYPGGVNRHIESLAEELLARGNHVRVIAPFDPPDRLSTILHRSPAEDVELPDYLIPAGRTMGISSNGSISNVPVFPEALRITRREIEAGGFDVVHLHEPTTPVNGWDTCLSSETPVVGTFHAFGTKTVPHRLAVFAGAKRTLNRLSARIAVSEAAAWTGRRWYGGNYTVIPNGVDLGQAPDSPVPAADHLRVLFVGRSEERKGLPVLLRAFEALVEHVPARLSIVGAEPEEVRRLLPFPELEAHLDLHGRVSREDLWRHLHGADLLCAPSLAGESFGMVLTEAFAAGTPVVASGIAGYSDVVEDGVDGVLVPPGDPQSLAEELQRAWEEPGRLAAMGEAAKKNSARFAWPEVTDRITDVYEQAIEAPRPETTTEKILHRIGTVPADGLPPVPPKKIPSPDAAMRRSGGWTPIKKAALGIVGIVGIGLTALAAERIGLHSVATAIVRSDLSWVFVALALMAFSLFVRAQSWFLIARAALPGNHLKRRDFASATMIGVLMSATLPARLGEPARALVLARHAGQPRESLPVIVGTIVSQTMLNLLSLALLGLIIVVSTDLFAGSTKALFTFSLIPLVLLLAIVFLPSVMKRQNGDGRFARISAAVHSALVQVRTGLQVFRSPKIGIPAALFQISAWAIQLASCWALLMALGLEVESAVAASAAVLFAVNVTAVVPATPSNIGIFQLAVISVLTTGFGVSAADALAYGVILQAVEIATAVGLGVPALFREGLSWGDMKLQAMATAPVSLRPSRPRKASSDRAFDPVA